MTTLETPALSPCLYVHPDNVRTARATLQLKVAVIVRPDRFMERTQPIQLIVETESGIHNRLFIGEHASMRFLIVYGRVDRARTTTGHLDYALTQEAISFLGISCLVGTFVVGSVRSEVPAGTVYVPHDLVGLGPHDQTRARGRGFGFRTIDMFEPFCPAAREALCSQAATIGFPCRPGGVYACFHGWPRVETKAELRRYELDGYDVVGQTLDPEATLAKEAGTHYAALAATVDDANLRERLIAGGAGAQTEQSNHVSTCRERMFRMFLGALPALNELEPSGCDCEEQASRRRSLSEDFYCRPPYLCTDTGRGSAPGVSTTLGGG